MTRNTFGAVNFQFGTCGFATTDGGLSNKLLFGKQKRIVVEDGKVYRNNAGGVHALSTTHIRIVLVRHR